MTDSKWIILDRDGVVNEDRKDFIKHEDEWDALPGSIEAIAELTRAGYRIAVATNQSGIGRGIFDIDNLEAMHDKMNELVTVAGGRIDGVFYCPHKPDDNCDCRKPLPGLLEAIEAEFAIDLEGVPFLGDSKRDLEAGIAHGCLPVLVKSGNGAETYEEIKDDPAFAKMRVYDDLAAFARDWMAKDTPTS